MKKSFLFIIFSIIPFLIFAEGLELPSADPSSVIDHKWYKLKYNEQFEQAEWVAYELTREELKGRAERVDNFRDDPLIQTGSAEDDDYRGSGYDRGHLIPAADLKMSGASMAESFYFSNVSPQVPGFNRGIWLELEACVRTWAWENEAVYIVTGPVLTKSSYSTIGANRVAVPEYFYKVILDYRQPELKAIGFILPNKKGSLTLQTYAVSVDRVEEITGIDFYHRLPDDIEDVLESEYDINRWTFKRFSTRQSHIKDSSSEQQPVSEGTLYWINTGSDTRHNPSCKYYGSTNQGYYSDDKLGKACGLCGGEN